MDDVLTLPVTWKGAELDLPLQIVPQGYTYRFIVQVEDTELTIERDDGGELRALIYNADGHTGKLPEQALVAEIVATIEKLLAA